MRNILFVILTLVGINTVSYADNKDSSDKIEQSNTKEQTASSDSEKQRTSNDNDCKWHFSDPKAQEAAQRVCLGGND